MDTYLSSIPAGREGWVYLIHAEGTGRYKIGRSINPIVRQQQLQRQSPYPLRIIRSFWSVDAIADELHLHECLKRNRMFGEWFDFEGTEIVGNSFYKCERNKLTEALSHFDLPYSAGKICTESLYFLKETYPKKTTIINYICGPLASLYVLPTSREELELCEKFIKGDFKILFIDAYALLMVDWDSEELNKNEKDKILNLVQGCMATFAMINFGKTLPKSAVFLY